MPLSRDAGTIYISLQLATQELQAGLRTLDKQFQKIGTSAQQMGSRLSLALTAPIVAIGTVAVKSFADFDKAMQNSMSVMGQVSAEMKDKLVKGAIEVSKTTTFSAKEAADGYFALASSGLTAAQSLAAIDTVAKFATAGQMDLAKASNILVSAQHGLGLAMDDPIENMQQMARIGDVLSKANIDTAATVEDFSTALSGPLAGAMRISNVSLETGVAILEAFAQQGIKGARAGTAVSVVIRELGIDAIKHAEAFKKFNVEVFDKNGNRNNVIQVLKQLEKAMAGLTPQAQVAALGMLGFTKKNIGFIQSVLGMGDAMEEFERRNRAAGGSMQQIAEVQLKAFSAQLKIAYQRLQDVAIIIGADLAPAVLAIARGIATLAEQFQKLPAGIRIAIEGFAALLAVIGPLKYAWGIIAAGFGALMGLLGNILPVLNAIAAGFLAIVSAVGAVPLAIIAAFVAAGVTIYAFWDDIKAAASGFIDWFKETFPDLTVILEALWILAKNGAIEAWEGIKSAISNAWDNIVKVFQVASQFLIQVWQTTWEVLPKIAAAAWLVVGQIVQSFLDVFAEQFPNVTKVVTIVWDSVKQIAKATFDWILEQFNTLIEWVNKIRSALGVAEQVATIVAKDIVDKQTSVDTAKAIQEQAKAQLQSNLQQKIANDLQSSFATSTGLTAISIKAKTGAIQDDTKSTQANNEALHEGLVGIEDLDQGSKKATKSIRDAAKAMDELNKKLSKSDEKNSLSSLDEQMKNAIDKMDRATFDNLQKQIAEAVKKGSLEGLADTIKKAGPANAKAAQDIAGKIAANEVDTALQKNEAEWAKQAEENAKKTAEAQKRAYDESVTYFRGIFSAAIEGGTHDFGKDLKEILVGFAADFAAILSGGAAGSIKSMADVGGSIAKGLAGLFGYGSSNGTSGIGPVANGDEYAASLQGGGGAGYADYAQALATVYGAIAGSNKANRDSHSEAGTGQAVGATAGGIIGAFFGVPGVGAAIGGAFGNAIGGMFKHGAQNVETKARHAFANYIEDQFNKLKTISFFDAQGKLKTLNAQGLNFLEGDHGAFNNPNWGDQLASMSDKAKTAFSGLGEAMKLVLGLADADGAQLGAMLAVNLGGSIDNARLLVQQLGLSFDDMKAKLLEAGKSGELTWHEWAVAMQGVTEAFKPGLEALADVKGAWNELAQSGGRGVAALKGVKDLAVEAMEAGGKTLDDLKNKLLAAGEDPAQVEALIAAIQQAGIKNLEDLAGASDEIVGNIVAGLYAGSTAMADAWDAMSEKLKDVSEQLNNLPEEIESHITLNVDANVSDSAQQVLDSQAGADINIPSSGTKKFAKGGLISRRMSFGLRGGIGIAGEAGPEFLMPAARMADGSLGIRAISRGQGGDGGTTIIVNAPGAAPGAEHRIMQAMKEMQKQTIAQTVDLVERRASRGGRRA